jgi:hypothetical protein
LRKKLKQVQLDPISLERVLQSRSEIPEADKQNEPPRDLTLETAVARMTEAAQSEGRTGLNMSVGEWKKLVDKHMGDKNMTGFTQEVVDRLGEAKHIDEVNRWLGLAFNIWNNTPQPDSGGKTAFELSDEHG